ncbi:Rrf2 family transcriptional regulator [Arthrobacter sp. H5]|uniref:RrF2 family transcriptional regulator n=1 Tax=Arthrobacter sp. H5 TaxID=1267973 RepID=UPI000481888C|nr:Rrf2 family transcriptional regulator [Arthrobacter sp. H5]
MRINAFSDVCLRVMMVLAPAVGLQTSRVIADDIDIPYNHVSKAVIRLRDLGLVDVVRGRSGGLRISVEGRRATVGSLLRSLDTREDLADCRTPAGDCPLILGCGLRPALRRAREAFYAELDDIVVADLTTPQHSGPVFVSLNTSTKP